MATFEETRAVFQGLMESLDSDAYECDFEVEPRGLGEELVGVVFELGEGGYVTLCYSSERVGFFADHTGDEGELELESPVVWLHDANDWSPALPALRAAVAFGRTGVDLDAASR